MKLLEDITFKDFPFMPIDDGRVAVYRTKTHERHFFTNETNAYTVFVDRRHPFRVCKIIASKNFPAAGEKRIPLRRLMMINSSQEVLDQVMRVMRSEFGTKYIEKDCDDSPLPLSAGLMIHKMIGNMTQCFPYRARQQALVTYALHNRLTDPEWRPETYANLMCEPYKAAFVKLAQIMESRKERELRRERFHAVLRKYPNSSAVYVK